MPFLNRAIYHHLFQTTKLISLIVIVSELKEQPIYNADSWRESLKYCRDKDMELICLSEAKSQPQATKRLSELNNGNLQEVWIGMRQSSLTGEYYWVNEDPVKSTNWQNGEPSIETSHKCVLMGAKSDKDFSWRSEDCCKAFHPVCYTETEILESRDD
uniref:C-type lectin domain-containing protein n=1 Tax=Amphiprion percula TaxID=161767 RepID=A0A3P8TU48_AMPPE